MPVNNLIKILKNNFPTDNLDDIRRAYEFAVMAFGDKKRLSGTTQIQHAMNVAITLADLKLPPDIVIAGMLHDIIEYTDFTEEDLANKFGKKIARLVAGENRLDTIKYIGQEKYAENLRQMFLAMAEDIQIIFIKFADRLDNLTKLEYLSPAKAKRLTKEALYIYSPIANRLGMNIIRQKMEDAAFAYLMPNEYKKTLKLVNNYKKNSDKYFNIIKETIIEKSKNTNLDVLSIEYRVKNLYSLYQKAKKKQRDPELIYDIAACRIIVPNIPACYAMLGLIHELWRPLPGRFKDYISQPKPNGYRSLHTNIFCDKHIVEIQIRTPEMHTEARFGIAAHWAYKEEKKTWQNQIKKQTAWLQELNDIQKEIKENRSFSRTIKSIKLDIFRDRIFILTPKGDVINLPVGATPLDFAYAIHADLGHHFKTAKVNNKAVPISYQLKSNEMVEITTNRLPTVKPSWENIAKTRRAKNLIRNHLSKK